MVTANRVFHKLDEIGNGANILASESFLCYVKTKNSGIKMLHPVSIEPLDL